ncbi:hypothetical protein ABGB18_25355 [Nonomuraea sp. B12E4]|uniref:hypothetical protein n=1 Tax=Nonomuraea sp. B12E4 TaxID=3153564 RepID=UPI00325E1695
MPIRGLPSTRGSGIYGTGLWRGTSEVTIIYTHDGATGLYGIDVNTGQARPLAEYPDPMSLPVLPGIVLN